MLSSVVFPRMYMPAAPDRSLLVSGLLEEIG
jgi:hypothetical protein